MPSYQPDRGYREWFQDQQGYSSLLQRT